MDGLPGWARDLLQSSRVGHLATATAAGEPFVAPACYALVGAEVVVAIDEKPKSGRRLRRLRNIDENPRASIVVDRYDEDWTRLAWVLVRGAARIVDPGDGSHRAAIVELREKYPQYEQMRLEQAEVIVISSDSMTCWTSEATSFAASDDRRSP